MVRAHAQTMEVAGEQAISEVPRSKRGALLAKRSPPATHRPSQGRFHGTIEQGRDSNPLSWYEVSEIFTTSVRSLSRRREKPRRRGSPGGTVEFSLARGPSFGVEVTRPVTTRDRSRPGFSFRGKAEPRRPRRAFGFKRRSEVLHHRNHQPRERGVGFRGNGRVSLARRPSTFNEVTRPVTTRNRAPRIRGEFIFDVAALSGAPPCEPSLPSGGRRPRVMLANAGIQNVTPLAEFRLLATSPSREPRAAASGPAGYPLSRV